MNAQDLGQRARELALSVERALGWRNKELQSDIELAELLSKAMDLLAIIDNAGKVAHQPAPADLEQFREVAAALRNAALLYEEGTCARSNLTTAALLVERIAARAQGAQS